MKLFSCIDRIVPYAYLLKSRLSTKASSSIQKLVLFVVANMFYGNIYSFLLMC